MRTKRQLARDDAKELADFYAEAHNRLVRIITSGQAGLTSRKRAKEMLAEVNSVIAGLDARTQRFIENKIPIHYKRHADEALRTVKRVTGKAKFTKIHEEAINAFVDKTKMGFATGLTATTRKAQTTISQLLQNNITRELAVSNIIGEGLDTRTDTIVKLIKEQGITGLVDKRGRELNIASYARMLAYTQIAEAGRLGVKNVALQNGFDLVIISSHNSKHQECAVWENKVISLTGSTKGYTSLDEATGSGLFHPGCQHTYSIIDEEDVTNDMRS